MFPFVFQGTRAVVLNSCSARPALASYNSDAHGTARLS